MSIRPVHKLIKSKPTMEGAGASTSAARSASATPRFDPFLLLDDFRNDIPADYLAGFPWPSPSRHRNHHLRPRGQRRATPTDIGNKGSIEAGDIQWMTAGRGVIHQEMPKGRQSRPHARLPVMGESPLLAQDDRPALSGSQSPRDRRRHRG